MAAENLVFPLRKFILKYTKTENNYILIIVHNITLFTVF